MAKISYWLIWIPAAWLLLVSGAAWSAPPSTWALSSAHPAATAAGAEMLRQGGNAFDAAVATAAALAVVEPYGSGLGGGGFFLLHRAQDQNQTFLDARETAPLAARRDMYLDASGEPIASASIDGVLAAGIPGLPAALGHLSKHYGRLSLAQQLQPAIELANRGFVVDSQFARLAKFRLAALRASPAAAAIMLSDNDPPPVGHRIIQADLAATLSSLANDGMQSFYQGDIAARLVAGVRAAGGIWSTEDLRNYRILERSPLLGEYHGVKFVSAPPPSSGGVVLLASLNQLAGLDLSALSEPIRQHAIVEVMRRAYRDRAIYLGDPDFVSIPVERLIHPWYGAGLRSSIRLDRATPSTTLGDLATQQEGMNTTHFSILDQLGNRVAATLSINYPFGSGFMVAGTGVLLNDEMDDFSAKPGTPNAYGLVGTSANAIAPGKRMLSSMTPTFIESSNRVAILGTPGGSRIISMVLLASLAFIDGASATQLVSTPRFHHQYLPDRIQFEQTALSETSRTQLQALGHHVEELGRTYGDMHAVVWNKQTGEVEAAADPRGGGQAQLGVTPADGQP